jgi:large subunit ribosomal protein L1
MKMSIDSKRYREAEKLYSESASYSLIGALDKVARYSSELKAKFDETVEAVIELGVDPKQTGQMVRGAVAMPNGLGRDVRVGVIVRSERVKEAKDFGADVYGSDELIEIIKGGKMEFDVLITTPDMMASISKIGKILGPKGLMPNPKLGTVSEDIGAAIKNAKSGQVEFRVEKAGIIHAPVGKISFSSDFLKENIMALYEAVISAKPAASNGVYMKSFFICTTQGPSLKLDLDKIVG